MKNIWINFDEDQLINTSNDCDLGKILRKEYNRIRSDVNYDHCVICGKQSPYTKETNINDRVGYIDGGGQGCYQPNVCDKI